jgi:hypothetical protein
MVVSKYTCDDCAYFIESIVDFDSPLGFEVDADEKADAITQHFVLTKHASGTLYLDGKRFSQRDFITGKTRRFNMNLKTGCTSKTLSGIHHSHK